MITRDKLLSKTATRYKEIEFEGETYRLRNLNERERAEYELKLQDKKGRYTFERARRVLIIQCLVDADGKQMLNDEDEAALEMIDGRITGALYDAAQEHCGYDKNEIEELVKNSESTAG